MIKIKDHNQLELPGLEKWKNMYSSSKLNLLEKSWAGVFREYALPLIPVDKLLKYYKHSNTGRPTKELFAIMGAVALQQFFNYTDEETVHHMAFNQEWHFALECFDEKDQLISLKTLWTVRNRMVEENISLNLFNKFNEKVIKVFNIDTSKQRLDSVHVNSNMARLGRIRTLSRTIEIFLKTLKKDYKEIYDTKIEQRLKDLFFKEKECLIFGQVRPSESEKTLKTLAEDMCNLINLFNSHDEIANTKNYKMMERTFTEHCEVKEGKIELKVSKKIDCTSLQNPSDPDAGYDGHKGQGYQNQIAETYSDDSDENALNIITYFETQSAAIHDSHALPEVIDDLSQRGICPSTLLCDAAYGSDKNIKYGAENNVEVISPVPGNTSKRGIEDFKFDEDSLHIIACPANHAPDKMLLSKKNRFCAKWKKATCENCPLKDECPAIKQIEYRVIYYRKTEASSQIRRKKEHTAEYKEKYRFRSGIEGTNSRFISQTKARRSRYRGLKKMSFSQILKGMFINIHRIAKSTQWKSIFTLLGFFGAFCDSFWTQKMKIDDRFQSIHV